MVRHSETPSLAAEVVSAIVAGPFAWSTVSDVVASIPGRHPSAVRRAINGLIRDGTLDLWPPPWDQSPAPVRVTLSARTAGDRWVIDEHGTEEEPRWHDLAKDGEPTTCPVQPIDPCGPLFPEWLDRIADDEPDPQTALMRQIRESERAVELARRRALARSQEPPEISLWGLPVLPLKRKPRRGKRKMSRLPQD